MARTWQTWVLFLVAGIVLLDVDEMLVDPVDVLTAHAADHRLTTDQQALVDFALDRFETQGLRLPELRFVFHDTLQPCDLHKGRYHSDSQLVEMCSLDKHTMFHELAHAWANHKLTREQMELFVLEQDLDSWNDPDHEWARRGTEHVAEIIAWAVSDEPRHVQWVNHGEGGSEEITYKILTVDVEVGALMANFKVITGLDPVYRDSTEWAAPEPSTFSPEAQRVGA